MVPTLHARSGGRRLLPRLARLPHDQGARRRERPACLTVSLIDGLVLARSAMHHSANYRSVMLLGQARPLTDPQEKRVALEAIVEHIVPGRWREVREPTDKRARGDRGRGFPIEEASAKIRSGGPIDDEPDLRAARLGRACCRWRAPPASPQPDALLDPAIPLPSYLSPYRRPGAA